MSECKHLDMTVTELEAAGYKMNGLPTCEICAFDALEAKDQRIAELSRDVRSAFDDGFDAGVASMGERGREITRDGSWAEREQASEDTRKEAIIAGEDTGKSLDMIERRFKTDKDESDE